AAYNALSRGKRSIALNLKDPAARDIFYDLVKTADVVIEGFRPGVVKRLGVDYDTLAGINPGVVCCSISGFGQTGPYSNLVGHDINYIATGGALWVTGREAQPPSIPINLVADFAGGGLMGGFAICVALLAREKTGRGQNVDMGMSDGVLSLMTSAFTGYFATGKGIDRGGMVLNGASHFYGVYETKDGRWFSLGSIEPHFYAALCEVLALPEIAEHQHDQSRWPEFKEKVASVMKTKTADEWMAIMSERDICAATVLEQQAVVTNPHNLARGMVVEVDTPVGKVKQIGVGPKLSHTPGMPTKGAPTLGQHTDEVLGGLGFDAAKIAELRASGAVG
ncbi:MAG: CaiB/BaiF CoA transferase family protein, partial [Dehalococcoidia bacterium]